MRHIHKGPEPLELRQWRDGQPVVDGNLLNCHYTDMPSEVKQAVRHNLLREQGYLCCYTGHRIDENNCHIEHLKPQKLCSDGEDIEYGNLLAAYPAPTHKALYGAQAKADWYDQDLLISPLNAACGNRFSFDLGGSIRAAQPEDQPARETIAHLRLDHDLLTETRRQIIHKVLIAPKHSLKRLQRLAKNYTEPDREGRLREFNFVIQQVAAVLCDRKAAAQKEKLKANQVKKAKGRPK